MRHLQPHAWPHCAAACCLHITHSFRYKLSILGEKQHTFWITVLFQFVVFITRPQMTRSNSQLLVSRPSPRFVVFVVVLGSFYDHITSLRGSSCNMQGSRKRTRRGHQVIQFSVGWSPVLRPVEPRCAHTSQPHLPCLPRHCNHPRPRPMQQTTTAGVFSVCKFFYLNRARLANSLRHRGPDGKK